MPISRETMERVAAREKERQRERTMQRDYAENREEFGSPAVDAEGKPYAPRGRVLTNQQLIDAGLAPYPDQLRAPSAVGHLPKLIKLGVPVPDEAVELIERTEALRQELIEVRREINRTEARREDQIRTARREMIQQLTEGVSFEDAILEVEDDGIDLETLRAKQALVDSAVRQMTQKVEALTDQDTMWPILAQAHEDSFVPDDFEASKAEIVQAEREGAKLRQAILDYQIDVAYPERKAERGARREMKNFADEFGGVPQADDYIAYRGGAITAHAVRRFPSDAEPVDFANLEIEVDEEDAA